MRANLKKLTYAEIAAAMGRKVNTIVWRRKFLGLHKQKQVAWTADERTMVAKLHGKVTVAEIARRLDRTERSVQHQASYLGITTHVGRPWKAEELAILRREYPRIGGPRTAALLGRDVGAVHHKANKLHLRSSRELRRWSKSDDLFIRRNAVTMFPKEIAHKLGRTPAAVKTRSTTIGVTLYGPKKWRPKDAAFVRSNCKRMTIDALAAALGRDPSSVRRFLNVNNLRSTSET